MAVRNYVSVDGEILGHYDQGSSKSSVMYVRDGLGSVVTTVDVDGAVLNTYRYKPFGDWSRASGAAPDPRFLWVGTYGYRRSDSPRWSGYYVRARHYSSADAAWTTIDPLWPSEMPYGYVNGWVLQGYDGSGQQFVGLGGAFGSSTAGQIGYGAGQAGQIGRGLPNGWRIIQGGKEPFKWPIPNPGTTADPIVFPTTGDMEEDYRRCKEKNDNNLEKWCKELSDFYHSASNCGSDPRSFGNKGTIPGPQPGQCSSKNNFFVNLSLFIKNCNCCSLRKLHLDKCKWHINNRSGHVVAKNGACRRCNDCWNFFNKGKPGNPPPAPLPQGTPIQPPQVIPPLWV